MIKLYNRCLSIDSSFSRRVEKGAGPSSPPATTTAPCGPRRQNDELRGSESLGPASVRHHTSGSTLRIHQFQKCHLVRPVLDGDALPLPQFGHPVRFEQRGCHHHTAIQLSAGMLLEKLFTERSMSSSSSFAQISLNIFWLSSLKAALPNRVCSVSGCISAASSKKL
jgi:hypothetical protein